MFPDSMKAFHTPNLDILGAPIGDYIHCAKFIASKRVEALKLLSRLQDVAVIDPQVAFTLLRVCGSFCRLAHIARSTPPSLSSDPLQIFDIAVKECFATCSALDLTEHAWQQAQLGLRYGGLGLRSLDISRGLSCSLCPNTALDLLGHHAVTCKKGGDVVTRHNRL